MEPGQARRLHGCVGQSGGAADELGVSFYLISHWVDGSVSKSCVLETEHYEKRPIPALQFPVWGRRQTNGKNTLVLD